jgi:hypothetical protein
VDPKQANSNGLMEYSDSSRDSGGCFRKSLENPRFKRFKEIFAIQKPHAKSGGFLSDPKAIEIIGMVLLETIVKPAIHLWQISALSEPKSIHDPHVHEIKKNCGFRSCENLSGRGKST